jgi:hypothetical protein
MSFKFKGTDITNIYQNAGISATPGYSHFPVGNAGSPDYANSRILPTGYTYYDPSKNSNIAISANAQAAYSQGSSSITHTIPSGAKQYRYIGAGGAGGGGGGGGGIYIEETADSWFPSYNGVDGGNGGYGGHGGIKYGGYSGAGGAGTGPYYPISNYTHMRVNVGGGGGGGVGGDSLHEKTPHHGKYKAPDGTSGGDGGTSYIFLTNSTSDTSASGNTSPAIPVGSGGVGGTYGKGGEILYSSDDTPTPGTNGGSGADGDSGPNVSDWESWGSPDHNNFGAQGNGSSNGTHNAGTAGGKGDEGWVQVIWLWD